MPRAAVLPQGGEERLGADAELAEHHVDRALVTSCPEA